LLSLITSNNVPSIKDIDFATWKKLASEADKAAEVPHENPPFTKAIRGTKSGKPKQVIFFPSLFLFFSKEKVFCIK